MSELKAGTRIGNWTVKYIPCRVCGAQVLAGAPRQKWCAPCRSAIEKERARQSYVSKYAEGRKCDGCGEPTPSVLCRWCPSCREASRRKRIKEQNKKRSAKKTEWQKIKRHGYVTPSHVDATCYVCKETFKATFRHSRIGKRLACPRCHPQFHAHHPSKKAYAARTREIRNARKRAEYAANPEEHMRRQREATRGRDCVICGTPFKAKYFGSSGKVCSKACKVEHWKRTMSSREHLCKDCRKPIERESVNPRFCEPCRIDRKRKMNKRLNFNRAPIMAEKRKEWRESLPPEYVANLLVAGTKLNRSDIPPELIEWKTMQLRLLRSVGAFGKRKTKHIK